jgi:hypothetical protein
MSRKTLHPPLPSPALDRAFAPRASRTGAVLAQPERDQETSMQLEHWSTNIRPCAGQTQRSGRCQFA